MDGDARNRNSHFCSLRQDRFQTLRPVDIDDYQDADRRTGCQRGRLRAQMIKRFDRYARELDSKQTSLAWSEWLKQNFPQDDFIP